MRITRHVYSTHIHEDPKTFGAMHPGGTQIYFVGDPNGEMVIVDTGEPYRSWTRQILDYHAELGRPKIVAILITHGHNDHIGGLDRLQDALACPVRCHPKLEPAAYPASRPRLRVSAAFQGTRRHRRRSLPAGPVTPPATPTTTCPTS